MGVYASLSKFLSQTPANEKRLMLSFAQIEQIIGNPLPPDASEPNWWMNAVNPKHPQADDWLSVGWQAHPFTKQQWVEFIRHD